MRVAWGRTRRGSARLYLYANEAGMVFSLRPWVFFVVEREGFRLRLGRWQLVRPQGSR